MSDDATLEKPPWQNRGEGWAIIARPPLFRWLPDGTDSELNPTPPIELGRTRTRWGARRVARRWHGKVISPGGWTCEVRPVGGHLRSAAELEAALYQHPDGRALSMLDIEFLIRGEVDWADETEEAR